jgi:hypothetical protein
MDSLKYIDSVKAFIWVSCRLVKSPSEICGLHMNLSKGLKFEIIKTKCPCQDLNPGLMYDYMSTPA